MQTETGHIGHFTAVCGTGSPSSSVRGAATKFFKEISRTTQAVALNGTNYLSFLSICPKFWSIQSFMSKRSCRILCHIDGCKILPLFRTIAEDVKAISRSHPSRRNFGTSGFPASII